MSFASPLDFLSVPSNEQDIIRCLVRRPALTTKEIAKFTKLPLDELERLLNSMVKNAQLTRDDENRFQVSYGKSNQPKQEKSKPSLLDSLFS